ncbi:MAG: anthranilate synthase component II, partial [Actinomycetota bacterium]
QCIGTAFGGTIERAPVGPVHGKTSSIDHESTGVFTGLPDPFVATRSPSLPTAAKGWPQELSITARSDDGVVMGVKHESLPIEGVQFHPESILTTDGPQLLKNFLATSGR